MYILYGPNYDNVDEELSSSFVFVRNKMINSLTKNKIYDSLLDITNTLISIRRQVPERKWHKDINREMNISELNDFFMELIQFISVCLGKEIELFYSLFTYDDHKDAKSEFTTIQQHYARSREEIVSLMNKMIYKKHNKVYNALSKQK
jgi:hypothetical protein